ncbi:MAG: AbrB/MazE/SpoVT family DNA-binding domain-containing protein [Bifidobacteriaceae bacterium]|nr:AbrB/MazE/SpoVT family DNA-binding domain-containing protein [Bifidobacteriaceae bacterium]
MWFIVPLATVSAKGQVVIPIDCRRRAGWEAGDQLSVHLDLATGEVRLRKVETIDQMADRFASFIRPGTPPLEDARGFYRSRDPRL